MRVALKEQYQNNCKDEKLRTKKEFYVEKCASKRSGYDWDFKAFLYKGSCGDERHILSELNAERGGQCNLVETSVAYGGCGLATSLMEICFTDVDVGGVDPETDAIFEYNKLEKWREMANKYCEHIVYLECDPIEPTPTGACSAYLRAAINTKHLMMFTYPNLNGLMDVMNVADVARALFKSNPDLFLQAHGAEWYFCKCKKESLFECHNMS